MRTMNITPEMAQAMTKAFAMTLQMLARPAETVTQAVVSVANKAVTGKRRISQAVMTKVKAQRMRNGGPVPNGIECWKLIDDDIIDDDGNYIADAKAPTASKTVKTVAPTKTDMKDMERLRRKGLIA